MRFSKIAKSPLPTQQDYSAGDIERELLPLPSPSILHPHHGHHRRDSISAAGYVCSSSPHTMLPGSGLRRSHIFGTFNPRRLPVILALSSVMLFMFTAVLQQPSTAIRGEISAIGTRGLTSASSSSGSSRNSPPPPPHLSGAAENAGIESAKEQRVRYMMTSATGDEIKRHAEPASKESVIPPPPLVVGAAPATESEDLALPEEKGDPPQQHPHLRIPSPSSEQQDGKEEQQQQQQQQQGEAKEEEQGQVKPKKALIFTMDSITQYEQRSQKGGASGEITIRKSLEKGLDELGFDVEVATSDADFEKRGPELMATYQVIFLDSWTWAAPGWKPKPNIAALEDRIFVLDFFGSPHTKNHGLKVPPERILTAFDTTPWNTFLGYYIDEDAHEEAKRKMMSKGKKNLQGVVWGKDPKHYQGKAEVLRAVADVVDLHSTLGTPVLAHPRIHYHGHQSPDDWRTLLAESRFLLGLEDPLLGPSAIDAISMGTMYINPIYDQPVREVYHSQHPYVAEKIGEPYVCTVKLSDTVALQACIDKALNQELEPLIPVDLNKEAYMTRLRTILDGFL